MLLQTDAQTRIEASTSAFFTQFTSVFVPAWVALAARRKPTLRVVCASLLVVAGCAVLSGVRLSGMGFGFGEWETIFAAALFTGQILCLERPGFQGNDMRRVAVVMFAVKALVLLPLVLANKPTDALSWGGWSALYSSPPMWVMLGVLTVFSTVYGYGTMTQWQPHVSSVQAGLIYATEPVFATLWALFLPGWFSKIAGIDYRNEVIGWAFCLGALAILLANVLVATHPPQRTQSGGA
jgi:drug/metabolite transporter (DMT)-like permease